MKTRTPRVPIAVQVGVVAVLFAASLIALAITIVSVLRREGRRSSVEQVLILAGEDLATRGAETLVSDPPSPFMSIAELEDLHRRLAAGADRELGRYDGVEGRPSPPSPTPSPSSGWGDARPTRRRGSMT